MKYLVLIQARCGSSRLPNKVMKDLIGKPVLQRMIERVKRSKYIDEVMVITSIERNNLPILKLCAELDTRVGIGSEEDVLDRFYQTAKLIKPKYIVRLTADCPCFDSELLDQAIESLEKDTDYLGMVSETFADGLDLEIMKYSALEKAWKESKHSFEREHVTQYIIKNPQIFNIKDFKSPIGYFGNYRWTLDEKEDFVLIEKIFDFFINQKQTDFFGYKEILEFLYDNPEIIEINKTYQRNEGLEKSINEDRLVF